ncbi:MAG: hypothetical protein ACR2G2_03630 [Pseudonocardia sp.]
MRDVLLGADPGGVQLSKRAHAMLADLRNHHVSYVVSDGTVLRRGPNGEVHWWTWAGAAANRTLYASLAVAHAFSTGPWPVA